MELCRRSKGVEALVSQSVIHQQRCAPQSSPRHCQPTKADPRHRPSGQRTPARSSSARAARSRRGTACGNRPRTTTADGRRSRAGCARRAHARPRPGHSRRWAPPRAPTSRRPRQSTAPGRRRARCRNNAWPASAGRRGPRDNVGQKSPKLAGFPAGGACHGRNGSLWEAPDALQGAGPWPGR